MRKTVESKRYDQEKRPWKTPTLLINSPSSPCQAAGSFGVRRKGRGRARAKGRGQPSSSVPGTVIFPQDLLARVFSLDRADWDADDSAKNQERQARITPSQRIAQGMRQWRSTVVSGSALGTLP